MNDSFLERLPYVVLALAVFLGFDFGAEAVRAGRRRVAAGRKRHRNVRFVLRGLAPRAMIFLGLLVSLVIALPSFEPAQLVNFLGISSVAFLAMLGGSEMNAGAGALFASVVYGLLALYSIGGARGEEVFHLIALAIAFSILPHSSTDVPVARWFRARVETVPNVAP